MKILHVITSLKIGGAESALYNLLEKFKNGKDEHYVAYFYDGPNVLKIKKLGFSVFQIKGLIYKYDFFAYLRLKKLVKKINPDVIHSALWSANIFSKLIAKKFNIPLICDLHSNFSYDGKLRGWIEKFTVKMADKYVAVSNSAKNGFIKTIIEELKNKSDQKKLINKILMIQNGIDVEKVRKKAFENKLSKEDLGFKSNDFIVGAVGRLEPIKSYDLLIESFALLCAKTKKKNIKLCIVGDGSQISFLKSLTEKLKISNQVNFVGQRTDVYRFYTIFDCFVLSSVSEGLSIALLEALCFGLPIITTSHDFKHDVIVNCQNGFLIPERNKLKLAQAIEKLYADSMLVKKIRQANLELVKSKFEIDRVKNNYQNLYIDLLDKGKGGPSSINYNF